MSIANNPEQLVLANVSGATASSSGLTPVVVPRCLNGCVFTFDLTSAATAAGDTLDVYVQALTGSGMWIDIVHFTQIVGNVGAVKRYVAKVSSDGAQAMFEVGTALTATNVRNILGDALRVRYDIVNNTTPIFSFSVTAQPC